MEDNKLETLLLNFEQATDKPTKINIKKEICYYFHVRQQYDEVRKHGAELLSIAEEIGDKSSICAINNLMAQGHLVKGEFAAAKEYLDKAFALVEEVQNPTLYGVICNNYSRLEQINGNYSIALEWLLKSEKLIVLNGLVDRLPVIYENIGGIYLVLKKYDTALEYYHKAISLLKDKNERFGVYESIAEVYTHVKDIKKADDYIKKAYKYFKNTKDIRRLVYCTASYAAIKLYSKQYNNALKYAEECIALAKEYQFGMEHFKSLAVIAYVYWETGELDKAKDYFEQALEYESACYDKSILMWFYEGYGKIRN